VKKVYKNGSYEADFSCGNSARGMCVADGRDVFIKRWYSENIRAQNEVAVSGRIENESVLPFFDVFEESGMTYAVREWIDASSLYEFVLKENRLPLPKTLDIMIKICMVLREVKDKYGNFVHADIRPANFLYSDVSKKIWFIDLETVTFFGDSGQSRITGLLQRGGYTVSPETEGFCAPEVLQGVICAQSDIYSLGKLFAFLLGVCGFDGVLNGTKLSEHNREVFGIIRRCTDTDIEKRYDSVGALLDEFCGLFNSVAATDSSNKIVPFQATDVTVFPEKILPKSESRIVVYVAGNTCFASELSYIIAMKKGKKTVLFEKNSAAGMGYFDYFIDRRGGQPVSVVSEQSNPFFCDCRHLYLTDEKQWVMRGVLSNSRIANDLYMSECDVFSEFDITDAESLSTLLGWTDRYFDVTVVCDSSDRADNVSGDIMTVADYIIVPVRPNIDEVYSVFKQYRQYSLKFGYPVGRMIFVAWEYEDGISMPLNDFKIAVDNLYGGFIPYDSERLRCKNIKGDFYCEQHTEELYLAYSELLGHIRVL